jgi:serine/threonine-protein kinase
MRRTAFVLACLIPAAAFCPAEPSSPAANAYAQGRELLARRGADDLGAAVQEFARAIAADPTFAPAFSGLAETRALLFDYAGAREAALRALSLDERQAQAHAVLGFVRLHADWDWTGAEGDLRRALEIEPQAATPHLWYAIVLEATGRSEEAMAEARQAVQIEPRKAHVRAGLGYRLYWARRYDEAVEELTAALDLDPALETAHYFVGRARVQQGRFAEARAAFARARKLSPEDPNLKSAMAYLEAKAGRRKESDKVYFEVERLALRGLPFGSQVAGIRLAQGDRDAALRWLERAHEGHEGALVWLKIDPRFDALRGEPRFDAILRRMGLAP